MPRRKLQPPIKGATNAQPYVQTPGDAGPLESMRNVVPFRTDTGRMSLGQRPGLVATFGNVLPGPVQAMVVVPRRSGLSGYEVGAGSTVQSITSRDSGPLVGQFVAIDSDRSILAVFDDTRGTGITGIPTDAGGYGGFQTCFDPDNDDIGFGATIARDTGVTTQSVAVVGLNRLNITTGEITHQVYAVDADAPYTAPLGGSPTQTSLFVNHIQAFGPYLFVAVGVYVYVFRKADLTYVKRHAIDFTDGFSGVTGEVQGVRCCTIGTKDYLVALIRGSPNIAGPVVADTSTTDPTNFGFFVRSGLLLHEIGYASAAKDSVAVGSTVLTRLAMPQFTQSGDAAYENHLYYRFSENSAQRPRGCLPHGFDMGADGTCFVARTNQGFGYDAVTVAACRPNSPVFVSGVKVVLTRAFEAGAPAYINPAAPVRYGSSVSVGGWEIDTDSLRKEFEWNAQTWLSDIPSVATGHDPHATGESPSLMAVALDAARDRVFFGGRRPSPSQAVPNVYAIRASDGARLWSTDLAGLIQQHAMAVDPTTGNVICGGNRNSMWVGASGSKAEIWWLDGITGEVREWFDLTDAVTLNGYIDGSTVIPGVYGVACNRRGQVLAALAPYRKDV